MFFILVERHVHKVSWTNSSILLCSVPICNSFSAPSKTWTNECAEDTRSKNKTKFRKLVKCCFSWQQEGAWTATGRCLGALSCSGHLEMTHFSDTLLFILLGLITFALFLFSKINSQPSAISELFASLNSARAVEISGYFFSYSISALYFSLLFSWSVLLQYSIFKLWATK